MAYISDSWPVESPERYRGHRVAEVKLRPYVPSILDKWEKTQRVVAHIELVKGVDYLATYFTADDLATIFGKLYGQLTEIHRIDLTKKLLASLPGESALAAIAGGLSQHQTSDG